MYLIWLVCPDLNRTRTLTFRMAGGREEGARPSARQLRAGGRTLQERPRGKERRTAVYVLSLSYLYLLCWCLCSWPGHVFQLLIAGDFITE